MHLDPRPFTLRQLIWMTEGRDKHVWSIASAMMALIANCHRDFKRSAVTADDFNPTLHNERKNVILITDENVNVMRDEFIKAFQTIGRRLTMLGLSVSIPFAASMKVFSSFDDQMRTVQAVTGATGAEFDKLTEKAKFCVTPIIFEYGYIRSLYGKFLI